MAPTLIDLETGQEEEDLVDLEDYVASEREPDYLGAAYEGLKDVVRGPVQLGYEALKAGVSGPTMNPMMNVAANAGKYLYDNPEAIAPVVGAGATMATGMVNPWLGAITAPAYNYLANRANEQMGLTEPQTGAEQIEQGIRNTVGGLAGVGGAKVLAAGVGKLQKLQNRFDKNYQTYKSDWEEANYPGSSAAPFNAPRGSTPAENMLADDVLRYEDKFYQMNPMKGVTKKPGTTPADEMLKNLVPQKEAANAAKAGLLEQLDTVGPGIKFDDLDLSKFSRALEKSQQSAFGSGAAINETLGTLRKSFDLPINQATSATPGAIAPSRVQTILNTVDDAIEEIGGWDKQTRAGRILTPSQSAKIDQLPELLKIRDSLKTAIENYSDTYSGAQGTMRDLNETIATARTYEDLIARHRPEVIQGMTSEFAGGRQMTSPLNPAAAINSPSNTLVNAAAGDYVRDLGVAQRRQLNLEDAWKTPERLQRFQQLRRTPFSPKYSNGFNLINKGADGFQAVMDALQPILPALASFDPQTLRIHDPNERRMATNATQNSSAPLAVKAKAISDLNGGKLPTGLEIAGPQPVQMPEVGLAYEAAGNALGVGEDIGSSPDWTTEDDRITQMMDEVDYDRSGY